VFGRLGLVLSGRVRFFLPGWPGLVLSWGLCLLLSRRFDLVSTLFLLLGENSNRTSKQEGQNSSIEKSGSLHIVLRN